MARRIGRVAACAGLVLGGALGLLASCFDAPQPAVQFSCDPDDAPECPDGYTCEADGCCHRDGSDVQANLGACQLGGAPLSGTGGGSTTETPMTESSGGSTTNGTDGSTSEGTTAGESSAGESSAGSSGESGSSGSSGAGSTGSSTG